MGGRDLADIYYIVYGTGDMGMNEASSGSYPYEIMCVKKELQKFSETYGFDRKKRLYELLKLPYDERQGIWRTGGNDTENTSQSICVPFCRDTRL